MGFMLRTHVFGLEAGRVLLMRRKNGVNKGLWVGLGGRLEAGESPLEAAIREFREESGLTAAEMHFRGLVTLHYPHRNRTVLNFLYACSGFEGDLTKKGGGEGKLKWNHLHQVYELPMPAFSREWMPQVINLNAPFYQARYRLNEENQIEEIVALPG